MKKIFSVCLLVSSILLSQAGERTIVIRQNPLLNAGKTKVTTHEGGDSDSLVVEPGANATAICVHVKDAVGQVLSQHVLPAQTETTIVVETPTPTEGGSIEISDDEGVVYEE